MPLGLEDKRIPDSAFTASSSYNNHEPSLARINLLSDGKHVGAWCPKRKIPNQWLQIDLGEITAVTKVAIQGRYNTEDRVKTYKLSYSVDGMHWIWYKQRAVDKVIIIIIIIITIVYSSFLQDEHSINYTSGIYNNNNANRAIFS